MQRVPGTPPMYAGAYIHIYIHIYIYIHVQRFRRSDAFSVAVWPEPQRLVPSRGAGRECLNNPHHPHPRLLSRTGNKKAVRPHGRRAVADRIRTGERCCHPRQKKGCSVRYRAIQ